jgi:hypothetical protein
VTFSGACPPGGSTPRDPRRPAARGPDRRRGCAPSPAISCRACSGRASCPRPPRRSAPRRARSACRRAASRARTSSAAGSRPDTTCPGRNAGSPPGAKRSRSRRISVSARRAWSARRHRCSTPRSRSRRSRRRSARRPWSGGRRRRRGPASTFRPSASSASHASSENGLVIRGCSATRVTRHVEGEVDIGGRGHAGDRRRRAVVRRRGERDVALASQQPGRGVEADPPGAGEVDLRPGVQVGEVDLGARGPVERLRSGLSWMR